MNVTLTPDLEAMIREKVVSGDYSDPSEVVREALRLLDERDRRQQLRAAVAKGLEQLERGEGIPYTPELREEIWQTALQKAREGRAPKPDVVP